MLAIFAFAAVALAPTTSKAGVEPGLCAWSGAPAPVHSEFEGAYKNGMGQAMAVLARQSGTLEASFDRCLARADVPKRWQQGAIGSAAIQSGAAAELLSAKGIDRHALDVAWDQAPTPSRDCVRANAQKPFGLTQATCSDERAPLWFLQRFRLSPQSDRRSAEQLLIFYDAKAQGEWADALIAKFESQPRK